MAVPASSPVQSRPHFSTLRILCLGLLLLAAISPARAARWPDLDPAELADKTPQVDPEAGAEILFREVIISHDSFSQFTRRYYVRAKIYSKRGVDEFAKIELPYDKKTDLYDIRARTTLPDGQSIEIGKKDIYDRQLIKTGKERVKVKSFSPPGLIPGAIVEYAYTEQYDDWSWYVAMYFQSDLPTRLVRFKFRPMNAGEFDAFYARKFSIHSLFFNCPKQEMKTDREGYYTFELRDLPAVKEEPFQPPALVSDSSAILCYSFEQNPSPEAYWKQQSKELHERTLRRTKSTRLVRNTLASIVAESDSPERKLEKIYDYCRSKILNRSLDGDTFSREERAKLKPNDDATDTLNAGNGTDEDINVVFIALARAADLDARAAAINDRSFLFFNPILTESFVTSSFVAAVRTDGKWRFFDPGARYLPFAVLSWQNTATAGIVADPKNGAPTPTDPSPAEASQEKHLATFQLDADGTLDGDVVMEFSGYNEAAMKSDLASKTPSERKDYVREDIRQYLKLAELTDLKIENAADPLGSLKIAFHLRVPEYADSTGSRLFFQPAVFQKNVPAAFPQSTRRTNILFSYLHIDSDDIRIAPPDGYELEQASAPAPMDLGGFGDYRVALAASRKTGAIHYQRTFALRTLALDLKFYPDVQAAFNVIHERDAHTLTFKRKNSEAPASSHDATSRAPETPQPAPTPAASTPPLIQPASTPPLSRAGAL